MTYASYRMSIMVLFVLSVLISIAFSFTTMCNSCSCSM